MIEEEQVVSILRFTESEEPLAAFSATCTLLWESRHVVWIKALVGKLSRTQLREFANYILRKDIHTVKSIRANGSLPFATKIDGNYCEIDVLSQKSRLERLARG